MNWRHRRCVSNSVSDSLRIAIISDTHRADHIGQCRYNDDATNHSMKCCDTGKLYEKSPECMLFQFPIRIQRVISYPTMKKTISIWWNQVLFRFFRPPFLCLWCFRKERLFAVEWNYLLNTKYHFIPMDSILFWFFFRLAKIKSVLPSVEAISFLFACVGAACHLEIPKSKKQTLRITYLEQFFFLLDSLAVTWQSFRLAPWHFPCRSTDRCWCCLKVGDACIINSVRQQSTRQRELSFFLVAVC